MKKKIEINCSTCDKIFEKEAAEVRRQQRRGRFNFYCSKHCCSTGVTKVTKKFPDKIKQCEWCGKDFITSDAKKANKCCSKKCAISQTAKFNTKLPQDRAPKRKYIPRPKVSTCIVCNKEFASVNTRQTCSKKCCSELMSAKARANPNCGGETNYKKFQYNGVWMDSSWEVQIAEWLDREDIQWVRTKQIYFEWIDKTGKTRLYFPDFYLPDLDLYLDPKNKFLEKQDKFKIEQVIDTYGISLVYGDIDKIKNHVKMLTISAA